jgi:hypothetical protein
LGDAVHAIATLDKLLEGFASGFFVGAGRDEADFKTINLKVNFPRTLVARVGVVADPDLSVLHRNLLCGGHQRPMNIPSHIFGVGSIEIILWIMKKCRRFVIYCRDG